MEQAKALIVVNDETVLDEVLRLAAAVGCVVERAADLPSARGLWGRAPLVVIDEEAARSGVSFPRRRVHLRAEAYAVLEPGVGASNANR
jgi:hypothetical protein